ncbi:MAG: amidohydrolase family protein [Bacteroidales bacterium]|jgi:cytosine/adenosine deaminase-related metal-dependent hydrolase|nr:amidohydrolase family protein [Bacteroidales bacterium]
MRRFSAQYIITNAGPPLKRGIVKVAGDGTIAGIEDTGGSPDEREGVEFHNGIIIPGFVNCHCHLELSHMKDVIPPRTGLAQFLKIFKDARIDDPDIIEDSAARADASMYRDGIVLCSDICNTAGTFGIKSRSRIKYISLLEVFGIEASKALRRMTEIRQLADKAEKAGLEWWIVPHAVYSISLSLFALLREETLNNRVSSLHFMETRAEKMLLRDHSGPLMDSYRESELITGRPETAGSHTEAVMKYVTQSGNLILVHNTFAEREVVREVNRRGRVSWCLCPKANMYIEGNMPPLGMLMEEGCTIVTGTDSYASNDTLSILEEVKLLQHHNPALPLSTLISFATINGARALGEEKLYGSIEEGKKPGLLLLKNTDLQGMRLLPETKVTRLI